MAGHDGTIPWRNVGSKSTINVLTFREYVGKARPGGLNQGRPVRTFERMPIVYRRLSHGQHRPIMSTGI
jgi:hypothetical protein